MTPDQGLQQEYSPADHGQALLEATEALRDELVDRHVEVPDAIQENLTSLRQSFSFDPGWLKLAPLQEVHSQLAALMAKPPSGAAGSAEGRDGSTALLRFVRSYVPELFHDVDKEPYATVLVKGVAQTLAVWSDAFRHWLAHTLYRLRGSGVSRQALDAMIEILAAEAQFDGSEHAVFTRVGSRDTVLVIDLGDESWSSIVVHGGAWSINEGHPIKFRRPRTALALPTPVPGGSIDRLWNYVNVDKAQQPLVLAFALAALMPRGPYPHLALQGEQGTAKSTAARYLKRLIDPSKAPLRALPSTEVELANATSHGHVLALDNLSHITPNISDALCRLSTGGGLSKRKLYSDNDEVVLEAQRPVILTSITDIITRPDLADRAYHVRLQYIEPSSRRSETELDAEFERDAPLILGALLDALAAAQTGFVGVSLTETPRLADAARLAVAAEATLGLPPGSMEQALINNSQHLDLAQLAAEPWTRPLEALTAERDLDLTPTDLLAELTRHASEAEVAEPGFPRSAKALSQKLDRIAPVLRRRGLEVRRTQTAGSNSQRRIEIKRVDRSSTSGN